MLYYICIIKNTIVNKRIVINAYAFKIVATKRRQAYAEGYGSNLPPACANLFPRLFSAAQINQPPTHHTSTIYKSTNERNSMPLYHAFMLP